jgi:hypothetical protein
VACQILSLEGGYCPVAYHRYHYRAADHRRYPVGAYFRVADRRRYPVGAYCQVADRRGEGVRCPGDPEMGDSRVADSNWAAVARVSVGCRLGAVADSRAEDCDSRKRIATDCFDKLRRDRPIPNSNHAIPRADH